MVTAINKAEAELERSGRLACLGDIVHNASEVERLRLRGLQTITHQDLDRLGGGTVPSRPRRASSTYDTLRRNDITVIDATYLRWCCGLQRRIKQAYDDEAKRAFRSGEIDKMPLFLIYGKKDTQK